MTGRSAWMFEEHPEGTLYRDGQVLHTSVARLYAAAGWTRFRRLAQVAMEKVSDLVLRRENS